MFIQLILFTCPVNYVVVYYAFVITFITTTLLGQYSLARVDCILGLVSPLAI